LRHKLVEDITVDSCTIIVGLGTRIEGNRFTHVSHNERL
jgi:hypothetical protein